jgi:hypothetical protein
MLTIAADPKHLGARIGITSVPPVFIGFLAWGRLAIPGRLELPTYGLGNRRSIRLSYGTANPRTGDAIP